MKKNNSVGRVIIQLLKILNFKNYSPIVLIKVSTIVLKEGRSERGCNLLKPPIIFSYQSSMMSTGWHAHLSYDWRGLPSGGAALALYCWQAPGVTVRVKRILDWTIVEVTLGPGLWEASVQVLGTQCWGITWGQGLWHLPQPKRSPRGKAYIEGQREAGTQARDLGWPKRSPRGKAYVEGNGKLGTRVYRSWKEARSRMTKESKGKGLHWGQREAGTQCIDLGWTVLWEDTGWATSRR